jgi:hypothetical protein
MSWGDIGLRNEEKKVIRDFTGLYCLYRRNDGNQSLFQIVSYDSSVGKYKIKKHISESSTSSVGAFETTEDRVEVLWFQKGEKFELTLSNGVVLRGHIQAFYSERRTANNGEDIYVPSLEFVTDENLLLMYSIADFNTFAEPI